MKTNYNIFLKFTFHLNETLKCLCSYLMLMREMLTQYSLLSSFDPPCAITCGHLLEIRLNALCHITTAVTTTAAMIVTTINSLFPWEKDWNTSNCNVFLQSRPNWWQCMAKNCKEIEPRIQVRSIRCPLGIVGHCETASSNTQYLPELQQYSVVNYQQ